MLLHKTEWNKHNYNFSCCFVLVWKEVSYIKWRTQNEGIWEEGAQDNIWKYERRRNTKV
jgi:hypothetical protein